MNCTEIDERLFDWIEGDLDSAEAADVAAHVAACAACSARARMARMVLRDLGAARDEDATSRTTIYSGASATGRRAAVGAAPERLGDFELLGELGRGGMGVVYRARQTSLNRMVALKVLSTAAVASEKAVQRFRNEAHATARLHHTNIVPIYGQGEQDGVCFYAMELIDGRPLNTVMAEDPTLAPLAAANAAQSPATTLPNETVSLSGTQTRRRTRDFKRIARLIAEIADALEHAHRQGIVHRDIKPNNLLLGRDDHLHITDFGLARLLDEPGITLSAEMVGTPAYMSPEQISGRPGDIGPHTDVYALGVTLYELLTLQRPFTGSTYDQVIQQVLTRDPTSPRRIDPRIPVDLETICLRAMEKEPRRRFASAAQMCSDLRRYAEDFPILSRPIGPLGRAGRWVRRHPALTAALAAAALVVVLVPTLYRVTRSVAAAQLASAAGILMDNSNASDAAEAQLGWAASTFGDAYDYNLVMAHALIRPNPARSVEILRDVVRRWPQRADARFLLAWAEVRASGQLSAAARAALDAGVAHEENATAAGWYFRGQALCGDDPVEAERSFERAIALRENFTQAMLQQARAMNQILYASGRISYYEKARSRLEFVIAVQSRRAYPRYLLALTHLYAAESFAALGEEADAKQAYEAAMGAARDAERVEPLNTRGYAAEAAILESQGDYAGALEAWDRTHAEGIDTVRAHNAEREAYSMRLAFWLGDDRRAEAFRAARFDNEPDDPDGRCYAALIAASAGRLDEAQAMLREALANTPPGEGRLRLAATAVLLGIPDGVVRETPRLGDDAAELSSGWDMRFAQILDELLIGARGPDEVLAEVAPTGAPSDAGVLQKRRCAAQYFCGVRALAAGNRARAGELLAAAARERDNENYCFRAAFLLGRLEQDSQWPPWISQSN